MADIKWSAFPSTAAAAASGDTLVGLHSGANSQFGITATATALAMVQWDTNKNLSANSMIQGYATTATAAGTTTLLVSSAEQQYFTGATTQTVLMPVTSTLVLGQQYTVVNNSSGIVTVQSSGANTIQAMAANTSLLLTCILTSGTTAASWNATYISDTGGTVASGTINQIAWYAATGNAVSGLATANSGLLVTSSAGVPSLLAGPGTTGTILQSNAAAAPSFSTATYPSTTTVSQILYSSSANVIAGLATANNGLVVTSNTGVPSVLAGPGTTGNFLQSNAAAAPSWSSASYPTSVGATGTILRSNGTNWVASTSTFADTYTASNLLYSNGSNTVTGLAAANNGLLVTSSSGVPSILAGTGTTGTILQSNAAAAPSFSTATYPSTTTVSQLLYSSSTNVVGGLATANSASLVTNSTGVPVWSGTMTNGQLIIGSTSATPTAATLTAGTGISITNGAASITIASTASGMAWSTISGTTQAAAVDNGYIIGNAAQTTVTLPAAAAIGNTIILCGSPTGTAGWFLTANTGQTIKIGGSTTSSAGSLQSANQLDNVSVVCIVANTTWMVTSVVSTGLLVT